MSLRAVYDDKVDGLRRDLDSLAADVRAHETSTESFDEVLARRLREWHLASIDAGEKSKRDEDDMGNQNPKRARAGEESETPPNLFDEDFQESEPPAPDPTIVGLPPFIVVNNLHITQSL